MSTDNSTSSLKTRWMRRASLFLFIFLVVGLAWYVWEHRQDMASLFALQWQTVGWMLLLSFGACVVNCLYHLVILRTYKISLSLTDWMGVVSVSNALAYVLPLRADLVFTAAYYKRVKGLAYTKSVSMAAGNIVFGIAFSLLQILASLLCIGLFDNQWPRLLWVLLLLCTLALCAFIIFALKVQGKQPALLQKYTILHDVTNGFVALLKNKALLLQLLACLIFNNLAQLLLYMVCFEAAGLPITLYEALFYNSVSWLSSIVAIVPGNIGIRESIMGLATLLMGAVIHTGVSVSLLQRVAVMVVYLLMAMVFAIPVYRRFSRGQEATPQSGSPM